LKLNEEVVQMKMTFDPSTGSPGAPTFSSSIPNFAIVHYYEKLF
jgi:hypothetical protein